MPQRSQLLRISLLTLVIALWIPFLRLTQQAGTDARAGGLSIAADATWTPTPVLVAQTPASLARPTSALTAAPKQVRRYFPVPPTPRLSPMATPTPKRAVAANNRVDMAGPITLSTVEPLPVGAGRAPVRLLIPTLGLDTRVLPMAWKPVSGTNGTRSEWQMVDNAAGHHINSAYPGELGNVVLSGHNNIGGSVFRTVCVIGEPGVDFGLEDEMILEDENGRRFVYQVNGWNRFPERNASLTKRQENARYMQPTTDARLTLVTCWPPTSNSHRVVVTGALTGMELK